MIKSLLYITALLVASASAWAQHPSKLMREAMLDYKKGNFQQSISKYKTAIKKDGDKNVANYNIGAAYYKAGKPDSALMYWQSVATTDDNKELQARSWHNIGNSFVKQGNMEKAVDAYKRALKLNPNDEDTRYNLAYSQRKLQQQQQQQPQQNNQPPPEDKEETKDDADKILKALDNKEKQLHNRKKGGNGQYTPSKDW